MSSTEAKTARLLLLCPRPRDVQLLEVDVGALSTKTLRLRLYAKQRFLKACLPWNVDQGMHASPHQVEPLTVDVLQMRIASGSDGAGTASADGHGGGRRTDG